MKIGFKIIVYSAIAFIVSCSSPARDNLNDPGSSLFFSSVGVYPPSESKVSGDNSIIVRFSDSMNPDSVVFEGDINISNASLEWSKVKFNNDTVTITPQKKIFDNGTGKSFYISGNTVYGNAVGRISVMYDVDYSVTVSSITPSSDEIISGHEPITVVFNDTMDRSTVESGISGDLDLTRICFVWSKSVKTDDTLTIRVKDSNNPLSYWKAGSGQKLVITGKSLFGPDLTVMSLAYTVENRVYVRADDGNDSDTIGTSRSPLKTIQKGITLAQAVYEGAQAKVLVAEGTYAADYTIDGPVVIMADGISLYGGYLNTKWECSSYDSSTHRYTSESVIENTCEAADGSDETNPTCAVFIPSSVSGQTVIDGFNIISGKGSFNESYYHSGILCKGNPIIQNNYICGRAASSNPGDYSSGITVCQETVPALPLSIKNNSIFAGSALSFSYGIYSKSSKINIESNSIDGGSGESASYGIYLIGSTSSYPFIASNVIDGGGSAGVGYGVYISSQHPDIEMNTFIFASGNINGIGIWELTFSSAPRTVSSNKFSFSTAGSGAFYRDVTTIGTVTSRLLITSLSQSVTLYSSTGTLADWNNSVVIP